MVYKVWHVCQLTSFEFQGIAADIQAAEKLHPYLYCKTSVDFEEVPASQPEIDLIGRAIPDVMSLQAATGEAVYLDDTTPSLGNISDS